MKQMYQRFKKWRDRPIYRSKDDRITVYLFGFDVHVEYKTGKAYSRQHRAIICLFFVSLYITLPWGNTTNAYDRPRYGFYFFEDTFVLLYGHKSKHLYYPWAAEWYRTSLALKSSRLFNGFLSFDWAHEWKGGANMDFWNGDVWGEQRLEFSMPYVYTTRSGVIQHAIAKCYVEQREWRPRWLMWTSLFAKIRTSINVDFVDEQGMPVEMGDRRGSWKGGVTGCSCDILEGDSLHSALMRMQTERKFD